MSYNWDLHKIYESDEAWESGKCELLKEIQDFKNTFTKLPNSLSDFLSVTKMHVQLYEHIEKVYCYPRRFLDLNINDQKYNDMFNQALDIYSDIQKCTLDFENLIFDNKEKIEKYLNDDKASFYKRYYEIIFSKNREISINDNFKIYQGIKNEYQNLVSKMEFGSIDVDGKSVTVNDTNYTDLLLNDDENIRKKSYELITEAYLNISDEISDLYIRKLKLDIEDARSKGYKSLKDMKLSLLELSTNLIDYTIKSVNKNISIMHNYVSLNKKKSGLKDYHLYDSSVTKDKDNNSKSFDIEEAFDVAFKCLAFLGDDYLETVKSLLNGSIDAFPSDGKKKFNFTSITYSGIPYICLNYNGKMSGVRSIIHEFGHAAHLLYSKENNDFTYFEFSLFLTEVVAKVNEAIFNNYLINENKKNISGILPVQLNSVFHQIMFTEFEDRVVSLLESGKEIDKEEISKIYEELLYKYNGDSLAKHKYDKYGWLRISHFIMQDSFYLYQYSIGTMLANVIYQKLTSDEDYKIKYLSFLGIGNKMNIIDSLNSIDINLFDDAIFDSCFELLNSFIDNTNT